MPVLLSCSCGRQLRAPDDYAGKRVKCPGCGAALTVPDGGAPAPRASRPKGSTPPPPSRAGGMIRFACACGKQMQAKPEYAGRMTRCPGCGDEVRIPGSEGRAAERIRADRPMKGRRAAEEEEDYRDEEEPEDRRGRGKKKRKKGVLPWVLAGVLGLVLLGGAGFGAWWFFFRSSASDMAFVPADAEGFMTIRVADVWKLDSTTKGLEKLKALTGGQDYVAQFQQKTGLAPEDVERFTAVLKDHKQEKGWFVVATKKKVDRKKILENLQGAKEAKHEGKTYHVGTLALGGPSMMPPGGMPPGGGMPGGGMRGGMPGGGAGGMPGGMRGGMPGGMPGGGPGGVPGGMPAGGGKQFAIYFASDRVVVFSDEKGVQEAISDAKAKKTKGPLEDAIKRAGGSDQFVLAANLPQAEMQKLKDTVPPQFKGFAALLDTRTAVLVMNTKGMTELEATLKYADDAKAKSAKTAIDGGVALGKGALPMLKPKGGDQAADKAFKQIEAALKSVTVEQKGVEVVLKAKIDPNFDGSALVGGLMMGGGKLPDGGKPPGGVKPPGGTKPPGGRKGR